MCKLQFAMLVLLPLITGCRPGDRVAPPAAVPARAAALSQPIPVTFVDVTATAGIRFRHTNGATGKRYFLGTTGSGACWLDYDNDGWVDLFVVDCASA